MTVTWMAGVFFKSRGLVAMRSNIPYMDAPEVQETNRSECRHCISPPPPLNRQQSNPIPIRHIPKAALEMRNKKLRLRRMRTARHAHCMDR
jgi:hypothetical protein